MKPAGSSDKNYYLLLGGPEHYTFFEHNARFAQDSWFWTVFKNTRVGDTAFIYLTAPVSRIVGQVEVIGEPFFNVNRFKNKKTKNRWMAEIGKVVFFPHRRELTMRGLREIFSDWTWLFYPRGSTKIPADILSPFLEMISSSVSDSQLTNPSEVENKPTLFTR